MPSKGLARAGPQNQGRSVRPVLPALPPGARGRRPPPGWAVLLPTPSTQGDKVALVHKVQDPLVLAVFCEGTTMETCSSAVTQQSAPGHCEVTSSSRNSPAARCGCAALPHKNHTESHGQPSGVATISGPASGHSYVEGGGAGAPSEEGGTGCSGTWQCPGEAREWPSGPLRSRPP